MRRCDRALRKTKYASGISYRLQKKRTHKLTVRRSTMTKDKEKAKTVYEIIEEVKASICDEYCRYPYQFGEDEEDDLYAICETCPLERL